MKSDSYWKIFTMSGDPEAYLQYKRCKRLEARMFEERGKNSEEFAEFEEFENADDHRWDRD